MGKIIVPDFDFGSFRYPEILEGLVRWVRENIVDVTDENTNEPLINILRAFALVGHLSNGLLDMVAKERFLSTAQLRESIAAHLALIGYRLKQARPAMAEVVARVNNRYSSVPQTLVPGRSTFSSVAASEADVSIDYETQEELILAQRTDRVGHVFTTEGAAPATFADFTSEAQSPTGSFELGWGVAPTYRDMLYIGHQDVMFTQVDLDFAIMGERIVRAVWEYCEGHGAVATPASVEVNGSALRFDLTSLLGAANRRGTPVKVTCALTGASYEGESSFLAGAPSSVVNGTTYLEFNLTNLLGTQDKGGTVVVVTCANTRVTQTLTTIYQGGVNKVRTSAANNGLMGQSGTPSTTAADYWIDVGPNVLETAGTDPFLGQTTPSDHEGDYTLSAEWRELPNVADASDMLTGGADGDVDSYAVSWTLPQTTTRNWKKRKVNGVTGYFVRLRVIAVASGAVTPQVKSVSIDGGDHYVLVSATQGRTVDDQRLASSTNEADQEVALSQFPVLEGSVQIFVEESPGIEEEYIVVESLLNSRPEDRHVVLRFNNFGQAIARFGDGNQARVPPAGSDNIRAVYRVADDVNGNLPPGAIAITGSSFLDKVSNPRAATGWKEREGTTAADRERLKRTGPESLQVLGRGVTIDDVAWLLVNAYVGADGSSPFARARVFEGGNGEKTVRAVVVGAGGGVVGEEGLAAAALWLNGDPAAKKIGRIVMNQQAVVVPYTPHDVNYTVKLYGGSAVSAEAALTGLISPLAVEEDGVTPQWDFGGEVALAKIVDVLMDSTPKPRKVVLGGTGTGTLTGVLEIVGSGTAFTSQLNVGDRIIVGLQVRRVQAIGSDTALTVDAAFDPPVSAEAFTFEHGDVPLGAEELPRKGTFSFEVVG